MMCCVLAFSGDYGKAIRETTEDILATRKSKDFGWIVEMNKGVCNILREGEWISAWRGLYFTLFWKIVDETSSLFEEEEER